jgi:hypothetical protein
VGHECIEEMFPQTQNEANRYILVGASHAGRLAEALDRQKYHVVDLSEPGWRASDFNVESICRSLRDCLAEAENRAEGKDVAILQLFDNCCYYSETTAGRSLPKRDHNDRKYHVAGKLTTATREEFKELLNTCVPILRAGGDCHKIILTPLARYVSGKCCIKANHIVNFADPAYGAELGRKLEEIRDWTKALAYTKRIRNFRVVSPQHLLGLDLADMEGCQLSDYWDADPVHLNEYGYDTLADAIINETCEESFNRATPDNDGGRGHAAAGRRPADKRPFERRQSWIMADEAVAVRTDGRANLSGNFRGSSHSFRHRGGRTPWRGRGGRGGSTGERSGKWPRGRYYNKPY